MEWQIPSGDLSIAANQHIKEKEYWFNKLAGELTKIIFPYDYCQQSAAAYNLEQYTFSFPEEVYKNVMRITKGSDYTLHIALVSGLALLLHKYTSSQDLVLGTPVYQPEVDGKLINTILPLRIQVKPEMTFKELLLHVRETIIEATENRDYPVDLIIEQLNIHDQSIGFPLFDITILLHNIHNQRFIQHLKTNMNFAWTRTENGIKGVVEFNSDLYQRSTIERIVRYLIHLFTLTLAQPDTKLNELNLLSEEEMRELVLAFNDTSVDYPKDQTIHELFEAQVRRTPDHPAVKISNQELTYQQLNEKANQLARLLRKLGVQNDQIVGIMLENSLETLIGIWGILKAGGAYLPIDPINPAARKEFIILESGIRILLTQKDVLAANESLLSQLNLQNVLLLDDQDLYAGDSSNLHVINKPDDLCYVIYTSGTSGNPKGVMIEHAGVVNYIVWAAKNYATGERCNFPLYTSIAFDLTVTSIFTPLITGNTVIIYESENKELLIDQIVEDPQVDVIKLTPSHLKLITHKDLSTSRIQCFIVGGEDLSTELARKVHEGSAGRIKVYNEYGPTETVVGCMIHCFDLLKDTRPSVPIGTPADNTQIYILNHDLQPQPVGVIGELCISGHGVARGYLNREELTSEKFIENPFIPGERMYRTGDLARFLSNGEIEFVGRKDQQVKIGGYRIELSEIASKLLQYGKRSIGSREEGKQDVIHEQAQVTRCAKCLLPANYPGMDLDDEGVCNICREYDHYESHVRRYFKDMTDFERLIKEIKAKNTGEYDCLLLYSGGKDSTYTLYRLIDMGLNVLTVTFDNGYISETAFNNIHRTTSQLGVKNIICTAEQMNKIFVKSLRTYHNVCNGCWNALNAMGAKICHEYGIKLLISGLSRGQIFDMRLSGLFQLGIFEETEIEEKLLLFRKSFHSSDNVFTKLLNIELSEAMIEEIQFVDFFRYDATPTSQIHEFLREKGWIQPKDTGFCSSNCLINDVGIYVHLREEGYHNYAAPLSWDIRLGQITRTQGIDELIFKGDPQNVESILTEIGYYHLPEIQDVVVVDREDRNGSKKLCAYIVADEEILIPDLRKYLTLELPEYMIPSYFVQIERLPLTVNGKIDPAALPSPEQTRSGEVEYVAPQNEIEDRLIQIWSEVLGIEKEKIGIYDKFFDLGGDSLNLIQVNLKVKERFHQNIPVVLMYKYTTVQLLADYLTEGNMVREQVKVEAQLQSIDDAIHTMEETMALMGGFEHD